MRPLAGKLSTSSATGDETHFCPVRLPRKTPSGGSLYRTRRNVRSPSLKVHVAALWTDPLHPVYFAKNETAEVRDDRARNGSRPGHPQQNRQKFATLLL